MDNLMMFEKHSGGSCPPEYAFGPDWVGMALFMDDIGVDSEDDAVLEWYYKIFKKRKETPGYEPTKQDAAVEEWMSMNRGSESEAILKWYHEEYREEMMRNAYSDDA